MTYVNREAVIFYFENDDTDARKDAYVLKGCLEDVFRVMSTTIEISKKDTSPAFTIRDVLNNMYHRMAPTRHNLPSLMILGYVGHGAIDNATGMVKFLSANGRQSAQWKCISQQWFSDDQSLENVDSLVSLIAVSLEQPVKNTREHLRYSLLAEQTRLPDPEVLDT